MLYRIGTEHEVVTLESKLPNRVYDVLFTYTAILDREYGSERNYLQSGGYSLVAETKEDVAVLKKIIDYDTHPCEWLNRLGKDGSYIAAMYLLNDDYSITLFMPLSIAPEAIINDLEE